ncbi:cytochrome P450 [Trametes elegans]|nr:cytochrome P450 [Trametes elegans]
MAVLYYLKFVAAALAAYILTFVLSEVRRRLKLKPLRNLPGPPSESFSSGALLKMFDPNEVPHRERVLTEYGGAVKLPAMFGDVQVIVSDPLAVTTMLTGRYRDDLDIPAATSEIFRTIFGIGLVASRGHEHNKWRKILNPVFSTRVLRETVSLFHQTTIELTDHLRRKVGSGVTEVELSEYVSRLSLEAVGRSALGFSFGPLSEDSNTDYSRALKEFGPALGKLMFWRPLLPWVRRTFPAWLLGAAVAVLPWPALRKMREISESVHKTSQQALKRKMDLLRRGDEAILQEVGEGKDLMSVLLRTSMQAGEIDQLPEDDLLGQMSSLLLAATDTTSSTIVRAVHLLAENKDVQDKLREEVLNATARAGRAPQDLDYDTLASLPYLDAIVRETVRLYPTLQMSARVSEKDVVLPLSKPVTGENGRPISEVVVPAGTTLWFNIHGANRDPDVWGPDAAEWKPERWLAPLPESVSAAHLPSIFANTLTFGAGPRSCIGYNFALTELRLNLVHLISTFEFTPSAQKIVWKLGGIISPAVEGSKATKPEFPVNMRILAA